MSPPSLIGDLAAVFLARTWHRQEGAHVKPEHDPQVLAATERLRRHLTAVLDMIDMPEPTRTEVVATLLAVGDVHLDSRPQVLDIGGDPVPVLAHHAALTIRYPVAERIEKAVTR